MIPSSIDGHVVTTIVSGSTDYVRDGLIYYDRDGFAFLRDVKKIKIPDTVVSIGGNAFYYCDNLEVIQIPATVTQIGDSAFSMCRSLNTVYYEGTEEQWKLINIGSSNTELTEANIIYNYKGNDIVESAEEGNLTKDMIISGS